MISSAWASSTYCESALDGAGPHSDSCQNKQACPLEPLNRPPCFRTDSETFPKCLGSDASFLPCQGCKFYTDYDEKYELREGENLPQPFWTPRPKSEGWRGEIKRIFREERDSWRHFLETNSWLRKAEACVTIIFFALITIWWVLDAIRYYFD